ncbi:glycosyltransferase [Desulfatirhabdium butyrativorans]|uniref:glycosyltransferase n=1 Tax=Desulfatirhabdium butyrativorans TaxID=340467 RepID=UPI000481E3AA|nr:glycosyltransferase [Desulfatirhabdium butyrativorans]
MSDPCISVILPAYNHEIYVASAIDTVLKQTFADFELLIIDDGSRDNTWFEIQRFTDERIRSFRQENRGAAAAINRGIEMARGRYIAILNSDDVYHPERLALCLSFMEDHPEVQVLASRVEPIDPEGSVLNDPEDPEYGYWLKWYGDALATVQGDNDFFFSLLQVNYVVSTSNLFIRSALFQSEKPFDSTLLYCHDYEFLLRTVSRHPFGFIQRPLLQYRLHPTNTIRTESFLKRFEVQYAVFHALDFEGWNELPPNAQKRMGTIWYRGLERNPDIHPRRLLDSADQQLWMLTEKIARKEQELQALSDQVVQKDIQIQAVVEKVVEKDRELQMVSDRIREKDSALQALMEEIRKKDVQLDEVGHEREDIRRELIRKQAECEALRQRIVDLEAALKRQEADCAEWKTRMHRAEIQLVEADAQIATVRHHFAEKERLLQEIFASKGWKWLSRYRDAKIKLRQTLHPSVESSPVTDEKTYHVRQPKRVRPSRPKVIHALANFLTGGSSRLVVDLVEHLGDRYDQEVVSFLIPTPLAYAGVPIHQFPMEMTVDSVTAFLKEKKADLLHVHYWGEGDAAWYRKVFQAAENWNGILIENVNTPVVPYVHDRIDHYVYVSEYARDFAACVAEKSSVIYPGSDLRLFDRGDTPIPDNVIGMVYRLDPDKLKENAIDVFIEVVKRRPTTQVLIVGGGYYFEAYRTRVSEQGASANFEFTHYVPYALLPEYYRRLSVFVAPVWKESFGQVSPFAMSMKIPVVGYRIGALPEILGDDSLLADNVDDLASILVDLLEDRDRRLAIGERNFERVHERFSVEAMIDAYERLYARLFSERKS